MQSVSVYFIVCVCVCLCMSVCFCVWAASQTKDLERPLEIRAGGSPTVPQICRRMAEQKHKKQLSLFSHFSFFCQLTRIRSPNFNTRHCWWPVNQLISWRKGFLHFYLNSTLLTLWTPQIKLTNALIHCRHLCLQRHLQYQNLKLLSMSAPPWACFCRVLVARF